MFEQKRTPLIVGALALILVLLAVAIGWRVVRGDDSLLRNVNIAASEISPNADGVDDVTTISYRLSRNGRVSIYFENENGDRFYFREEKPRGAGDYRVAFSGIVDGFTLPDDQVQGQILSRLLPDGLYTWTVEATDERGVTERQQGQITIRNGDPELPDMRNFSLDRTIFTPNRDGIDDRLRAQFFLIKDVADLRVFLLMPDGSEQPVLEYEQNVPARAAGWHYYDYAGGVDEGATPPPDGTYPIVAIARDKEGQVVRVENEFTIQYGGVPRAHIFPPPTGDTVSWNVTAVAICDTLYFTLTVENYGTTPIRTSGPPPGTVYDSDWNYNTLGWFTESGAFRVGIGYENEITNYPYRWAVGSAEDLTEIDGHYYLMPGDRAVVTGGIRLTNVFGVRNPQPVWAGLIHEDVEVSQFNSRVDPAAILVDAPDEGHMPTCEPRDLPLRPQKE
ncbi:MAG: hypothetical protein HND44_18045 [Chloroflexi bacterium]|nr:hypothetical protein [Chloroflexota bacterium]